MIKMLNINPSDNQDRLTYKCNYNFQRLMDLANNIKTIKGDTGATGIPGMQGVHGPMGMTGYSIYPYPVYSTVDMTSGTTQAFIGANNPRIGDFFVL